MRPQLRPQATSMAEEDIWASLVQKFGGRLAPSLPCHSSRSRSLVKTSSTAASDASRVIWAATSSKTRARRARGGTNLHRGDLLHTRAEVVVAMDPAGRWEDCRRQEALRREGPSRGGSGAHCSTAALAMV